MQVDRTNFVEEISRPVGWVVRMRPNFRTNESPIYFLGNVYNGKEGKWKKNNVLARSLYANRIRF